MSIKSKKSGAIPTFPHRWQELAKDSNRHVEAAREYRALNPNASLVEASRAVRRFASDFNKTWGKR